jgi:hypothetical protein
MQSVFNFFGQAFIGAQGAGTLVPDIGLQLRADGTSAQLRSDGSFQLRNDGTKFSSLTMIDFFNPNNLILDSFIGY